MNQTAQPTSSRPNILRRLYAWTLSWAESPFGTYALFLIAFVESSFFPIPPDVLLLALTFAKPAQWWLYGLICTAGSVAGGVLGWVIGLFAWQALAPFFFQFVPGFKQELFDLVQLKYQENAFAAILMAAFTPIPYKVFTIASGVFSVDLWTLIVASILGRGGRFFLVGGIIRLFGPNIRPLIEKYFEIAVILLFLLGLAGFLSIKLLH